MTLEPVILAVPQIAPPRSPRQVRQQRDHARLALRHCAQRCGAPVDGWAKDDREVPLPNAGYFWSVSHKQQWAAAVIADLPVGIDIEHVTARPRELHDRLAEPAEWSMLGDRSWASFYLLWTAKEAVLKAVGVGIAGFMQCRLLDVPGDRRMRLTYEGKTWTIEHYHYADHVFAVTCGSESVRWCVLDGTPGADEQVPSTRSSADN